MLDNNADFKDMFALWDGEGYVPLESRR